MLEEMKITANPNASADTIKRNIRCATTVPPFLDTKMAHNKVAWIIGGGPSLQLEYRVREALKLHAALSSHVIFSCNNMPEWLLRVQQVRTHYHVMVDPQRHLADWARPVFGPTCIYATQCDPGVTSKTDYLFHAHQSMGSTVGLQMIWVAWQLGYRNFMLCGMDSSITEGWSHYNDASIKDALPVELDDGQKFLAAPWMILQAQEYEPLARRYIEGKCKIEVLGKGLLPAIHHRMMEAISGHSKSN